MPPRIHVFSWAIVTALVLALWGISRTYRGQDVWQGWRESADLRHTDYAERIHVADVFRTQANTWSNLAYVLVGLYVSLLPSGSALGGSVTPLADPAAGKPPRRNPRAAFGRGRRPSREITHL